MPNRNRPGSGQDPEGEYMPNHDQEDETQGLARAALRNPRPFWEHPLFPLIISVANFMFFTLVAGYLTLWMDAHNDQRYLKQTDSLIVWSNWQARYNEGRENDKRDRESIRESIKSNEQGFTKRLDRQEQQLDTIAADIKTLLRQPNHQ